MTLTRDPFFQRRSEWAKYKHRILDSYLRVWVHKLATRSDNLAFVDTCAGEGTYGHGEPGSPLIAAHWNDRYLAPKGKRLLVIACEQRRTSFDHLREVMEPYTSTQPPLAIVLRRSFVDALPVVLEMTRHVPTLLFIDPYGMKDLTAANLSPLLKSRDREPTEALVRVPPKLLARFMGWLKAKERNEKGKRTAASFRRLLDDLRIDPELLRAVEGGAGNPIGVNELLLSYLEVFEGRFRYVHMIPIRDTYEATPKYYLVHGTDNEHGLAHMNDVVSKAEDDLFQDSYEAQLGGQMSLLDPPRRQPRVTIADAQEHILALLRQHPTLPAMRIRAELVRAFGPDLREKHHKQAIHNLETLQQIERAQDHSRFQYRHYRLAR